MAFSSILSQKSWRLELESPGLPGCDVWRPVLERAGWAHAAQHNATVMAAPRALAASGAESASSSLAEMQVVILGCSAFMVFVILNASERISFLPVGRVGSTLVGAFLMVVLGVVPTEQVTTLLGSNLALLLLVWGCMVISHYLNKHGRLVEVVDRLCMWCTQGAWDSCFRFSLASSVVAALLGWDIAALMLAPLAVELSKHFPHATAKPFLAAVATGANAGSILTPMSNPGNAIVTLASGLPFATFAKIMALPWLLVITLNALGVVVCYANLLLKKGAPETDEGAARVTPADLPAKEAPLPEVEDAPVQEVAPETAKEVVPPGAQDPRAEAHGEDGQVLPEHFAAGEDSTSTVVRSLEVAANSQRSTPRWQGLVEDAERLRWVAAARRHWRGAFAYATWGCCLVAWFRGEELGAVAAVGGVALLVAECRDCAEPIIESAEWPVIAYIAGIFIVIPGFNLTGVPGAFWDWVVDAGMVSVIEPLGIFTLILVTALFANIVTNVPAVLLLGSRAASLAISEAGSGDSSKLDSPAALRGWLMVAFIAGVSGSLTVQGSITQVIAYEAGRRADVASVSFVEHLRVGVPVTVLSLAFGLPLLLTLLDEML